MNELELVQMLTSNLPTNEHVVVGPGDDCAVLQMPGMQHLLLFKTDSTIEGVHFASETEPYRVGRKALARCLSDIAAMGGTPIAALVAIALPKGFEPQFIIGVYKGISDLAAKYNVAICGGETCRIPGPITITVSSIGIAEPSKCVLRSQAKPGDAIFVTGELGGSILGKHLDFEPRINEARWLVENFPVHAMMDISDGLALDLKRLLASSGVGAELLAEAIPISRAAREKARQTASMNLSSTSNGPDYLVPGTPLAMALTDGEDYELLFTVPPNAAVPLLDAWKSKFPETKLSCIGKITPEKTITIRDKYGRKPLTLQGYIHFA